MLDKSITYKNIIMKRDNVTELIPEPVLPQGFSFRFFTPSDVKHWARIETSVLEFDSEDKAESYFTKNFCPRLDELRKRCLFAVNPDGLPIATATAWYEDGVTGREAWLHWVATCPEYQGMGIGKAITLKALRVFHELEPGRPIWLNTQTWSHVAVRLYHSLGFNMVRKETPTRKENDFDEAVLVLASVMDADFARKLRSSAV